MLEQVRNQRLCKGIFVNYDEALAIGGPANDLGVLWIIYEAISILVMV